MELPQKSHPFRINWLIGSVAIIGLISMYWSVVPKLVLKLWNDPNFSHGLLVPFFSFFLIWQRRNRLRLFPDRDNGAVGILLIVLATFIFIAGKAGVENFSIQLSLVIMIAGLFYIVFGKEGFMECMFPIGFLLFMIPIPFLIYDSIAFPMKIISSKLAVHLYSFAGIPVFQEGNILQLADLQLEVIDACSGIRSLMSLLAISLVVANLFQLGYFASGMLSVLVIPLTILVNATRLLMTGVLSLKYGRHFAEGTPHEITGWLMFLLGMIVLVIMAIYMRKPNINQIQPTKSRTR